MEEEKVKQRHRFPIWGIILVLLGVILLLQTFNVLPWGLWGSLWRLWPLLLIAIGLNIILSRVNVWLAGGVVIAIWILLMALAAVILVRTVKR